MHGATIKIKNCLHIIQNAETSYLQGHYRYVCST